MSAAPQTIGQLNPEFKGVVDKVSKIIHELSGNKLGEKQSYMVETRVRKRMMELALKTPQEYIAYIDKNYDSETSILIGLITTHHTFFFREFPQFEFLKKMLPEIVNNAKKRNEKVIKIWSAACSKGQEVYSLALFMEYYLPQIDSSFQYKIYGSDIDPESVRIATNGVYHHNEVKEIPMNFMGTHWARGTGDISQYSKIKSSIRLKCEFKTGNLLKVNEIYPQIKFDVIFCRNVFIYFEPHQVELITKNLFNCMYSTGIFFSGISEPLSSLSLKLTGIGPSVYKQGSVPTSPVIKGEALKIKDASYIPEPQAMIRVMCVDDSSSILTLLKKVLSKENGFEVVATAINGKDAMEKLKSIKVDVMTLDIHMPEMDGITYLKMNHSKTHPPVMMISSASRDDSDVAMQALKFGAVDYVEKPSLNVLEERGEEIRAKLRTAFNEVHRKPLVTSFDKDNQRHFVITKPEEKVRVVLATISDLPRLKNLFKELDNIQPPTFICFEGTGEILEKFTQEKSSDFKLAVQYFDENIKKIEANKIYFVDSKKYFPMLFKQMNTKPTSVLAYGNVTVQMAKQVCDWKGAQILLEDLGDKENVKNPLRAFCTDVVPVTSFPYMSCRYLSTK